MMKIFLVTVALLFLAPQSAEASCASITESNDVPTSVIPYVKKFADDSSGTTENRRLASQVYCSLSGMDCKTSRLQEPRWIIPVGRMTRLRRLPD